MILCAPCVGRTSQPAAYDPDAEGSHLVLGFSRYRIRLTNAGKSFLAPAIGTPSSGPRTRPQTPSGRDCSIVEKGPLASTRKRGKARRFSRPQTYFLPKNTAYPRTFSIFEPPLPSPLPFLSQAPGRPDSSHPWPYAHWPHIRNSATNTRTTGVLEVCQHDGV